MQLTVQTANECIVTLHGQCGMKIVYDHQIFAMQEYGGVSRYFFELADNIAKANAAEVAIFSPLYTNSYLAAASRQLQVRGMKMPAIRRSGLVYRAINRIFVPSMMGRFHPDIVHQTYYSLKSKTPAASKVVLTVFDMIHERFPDGVGSWDSTSREKAKAVERADHVVCISEQTRKDLIELLGVNQAKTSVVHLGFSLTKQLVGSKLASKRPYLLYVGSRGGYKNFESLLHAYAANLALQHDYDLLAFGGGPLNAKEKALVAKLGIPFGRVRHLSGDDSVLSDLYRNAALFVYPSRYEGFGIPPLEAMSFDCPVACSNTSSIPEVVGDAAEFFNPDSVESIGYATERVLNDTTLRHVLIARGRERIKLFSWERCAEQTLDVYRSLLT